MRARILGAARVGLSPVNLLVAASVLVWLTGAIESFSNLPLWVLASAAAAALGAGFVKDSEFRIVPTVGAALFVLVVGGASYFLTHLPGGGSETTRAPLDAVLGGVRASLEARNQTTGTGWRRTIEADGGDELQFRLVVQNPASTPSASVVIRVLARENSEEPREIDICFARTESGAMEEGPIVKVVAQSNGLGPFTSWRPQIGFPSPVATRLISLGQEEWTTQGSEFRAQDYTVPALSAHERMVITFGGLFGVPDSGQIGGASLDLKNLTEHQRDYESVTSARPGDVIQAYGVVHNSGFRSVSVFARVRFTTVKRDLYDRVSVMVREHEEEEERELGHGIVNASGSEPIELSVIPGTTELRTPQTGCSEAAGRLLPDGLTKGGVELGLIGGFEPRDPCHSSELTRALFFRMRARGIVSEPSS
jgi:hypothetical protein